MGTQTPPPPQNELRLLVLHSRRVFCAVKNLDRQYINYLFITYIYNDVVSSLDYRPMAVLANNELTL
jgi:hypothetical protein